MSKLSFLGLGILLTAISIVSGPAYGFTIPTGGGCDAGNGTFYQNDDGDYCLCPDPMKLVGGMSIDDYVNACLRIKLPVVTGPLGQYLSLLP